MTRHFGSSLDRFKELLFVSNCHGSSFEKVQPKTNDWTKKLIDCPKNISDYNKLTDAVDLSDHWTGLYDFDRKSQKCWRKIF